MKEKNIFIQIMELIEKNTDMPLLQIDTDKYLEEWLEKNEENKNIYEIYKKASDFRRL